MCVLTNLRNIVTMKRTFAKQPCWPGDHNLFVGKANKSSFKASFCEWDVRGSNLETTTDLDQVCNIANQLAWAVTVTCILYNTSCTLYIFFSINLCPPDHCQKPPALPLSTFSTTSWQTNTARCPCAAAKDSCGSSGHPRRVEADSQSRREAKENRCWNGWKCVFPHRHIHPYIIIVTLSYIYSPIVVRHGKSSPIGSSEWGAMYNMIDWSTLGCIRIYCSHL